MESTQDFKLVNGTFSANDAANVLFSLIGDKIKHHQLLLFSNEERYGADITNSKIRIEQLTAMKEEIADIIRDAREDGMELEITSNIQIVLKESVKATV